MNGANILRSLELSAAAYRDIQPFACTPVNINLPGQADVHYLLHRDGDTLWIVFRGSDSLMDWKANLSFPKKRIPYDNTATKIRVHRGFLGLYKKPGVRDRILSEVTPDVRRVRITGHSLGAALTVLCAVDIQYNYPGKDIEVILFGCPRVGNLAFVKSYNKRVDKTVRVENGNDVVTKVPPAIFGFRHVGAKLHIGTPRLFGTFSANDHYPHRYYEGLLGRTAFCI
jgi:predicted lipase